MVRGMVAGSWRTAGLAGSLAAGVLLTGFTPPQAVEKPEQPAEMAATVGELTPTSRRAYAEVLKLRLGPARELLRPELASTPAAPAPLLVANCIDFADLLLSQDAARYEAIEKAQEARLARLDKVPTSAMRDYARAEITLHLGLSQLLFKHLVMGGYHLRSGYRQMQDVVKRYPAFLPARKTLGICQFAVGSLPEGYHWLLSLLGLTANSSEGLKNLALAAAQPHDFQIESQIYLSLIREGYYKKPEEALRLVEHLHAQQPDNLLFSYLLISINKRQHHGEAALAAYRARPTGSSYVPVPYLRHMAADLLLYKGDYADSERENLAFLREYRGVHYRKDAAFKLYLAAWLGGQPAAAVARYREQINQPGPTDVEEDNYAQHYYHEAVALNPILTRARLQTDGGYNQQALATLRSFRARPATLWRDRIEEPYRRARAFQGLGRLDSAWFYFERTQTVAGPKAPYYFAPQAALQQGYLAQEAGNKAKARIYFERALHYPWHEYKNSTDAKATLALRELK
ncbi:DUF3808 domain-containing protein [Hymenobacter properus]|uniref:DUF3808 domain-containing protein n=1 Tax=Hymenobacter properus TaxID=2791026 RepID=A0A931FKS7_9BACT|nr:DUF3808 domain-containing protein [Hymenobacter properus]MBF9140024.1 DUF3808 domain-containing protein [Hymenobacter properus]MBR7718831.1 hypothetical protein [Microvirga sp. SRT04]